MMKYDLLGEYLRGMPDNEIVCVIDAYDVVLLEPLRKLEEVFKKTGARIVVAEDCVPNVPWAGLIFGKCKGLLINAGTYIGYAGELRKMVSDICKAHDCKDKKLDDQRILAGYCNSGSVHVDKARELFFLMCYLNRDPKVSGGRIVYNGVMPCILHAPANKNVDGLLRKLGYDVKGVDHRFWQYWGNLAVHHWYFTAVVVFLAVVFCFVVSGLFNKKRR